MPIKDKSRYNAYMKEYNRTYRKSQTELIRLGREYRKLLLSQAPNPYKQHQTRQHQKGGRR